MLRRTFWPESTTHVTPKEVVDDGNGGTCAMPLRWPWAREAAFRVLRAQELDFVVRVELDASKPFEVVCVVPKVSDDFGADVQRVHDLLAKALDIAPDPTFFDLAAIHRLRWLVDDVERCLEKDRPASNAEAAEHLAVIADTTAHLRAYVATLPTG